MKLVRIMVLVQVQMQRIIQHKTTIITGIKREIG
jgi:hypothetical protein